MKKYDDDHQPVVPGVIKFDFIRRYNSEADIELLLRQIGQSAIRTNTAAVKSSPTALSASPDASPEPESEEQKLLARAQQLAQQPEVKAVFKREILAMTDGDGRWLRLCQLLAPGGDLAQHIDQKPKQINTYILVQVLCDEGWTRGLTPKDADKLGTALSGIIGTTTALDLTQRISKGKSTLLDKWCGLDELPPARDWEKSGLPAAEVATAKYMLDLLCTP